MKKELVGLLILSLQGLVTMAQTKTPVDQALEGGKVLVELIKVFSNEKDKDSETGCRGRHADLCILNARDTSLTVALTSRPGGEERELVITRDGKECCLQLHVGVWTYGIKLTGIEEPIRKGDLLIEGCNNLTMTIK